MTISGDLKPRKLPRQERSAATVEAILIAGAQILERDGLAGYTTNAVAERAGVSIGSLYQYFPNKQALTVALLQRSAHELEARLTHRLEEIEGSPFEEGLRALIEAGVDHQLARPALERILDYEERNLPLGEPSWDDDRSAREIVKRFLATHFPSLAMNELDIVAADIQGIARTLIDLAAERDETDRDAIADRVTQSILGYLRCQKSEPAKD